MPRPCTICAHSDLKGITHDLMARTAYRTIQKRYGVSKSSIDRHVRSHVSKALRRLAWSEAQAEMGLAEAELIARPVLPQMRELQARTLRILRQGEDSTDHATALAAIREGRRNLELIAKLTGELDPRAVGETSGPLSITVQYVQKQTTVEMLQGMPRADVSSPVVASLGSAEGSGGQTCPR